MTVPVGHPHPLCVDVHTMRQAVFLTWVDLSLPTGSFSVLIGLSLDSLGPHLSILIHMSLYLVFRFVEGSTRWES